jgi:hypothetical protein
MIPQPHDTVIVTNPSFEKAYGKEHIVAGCSSSTNISGNTITRICVIKKIADPDDEQFWLSPEDYEVLENTDEVKVGDTVIITSASYNEAYCKKFMVIAFGAVGRCRDIYIEENNKYSFIRSPCYRIIKRDSSTSTQLCLDCHGMGKIDLFTSTVKCHCTGEK